MKGAKKAVEDSLSKEEVPIFVVAKSAGMSVQTTSKYCHILEAEGKLVMRKFGNMKLVRRNR